MTRMTHKRLAVWLPTYQGSVCFQISYELSEPLFRQEFNDPNRRRQARRTVENFDDRSADKNVASADSAVGARA